MTHTVGSEVDVAGRLWTIVQDHGDELTIEHADGGQVTVPREMFGPEPGTPQVGDVWLFESKTIPLIQGYVQVIGGRDNLGRIPVVYVAERHPERAKIGRFYAWPEELTEKLTLQVATAEPLADGGQGLHNADPSKEPGFIPGKVYLFTQAEQGHTGPYPTGRVVYLEGIESSEYHWVRYADALTNNGNDFWVRSKELSEV